MSQRFSRRQWWTGSASRFDDSEPDRQAVGMFVLPGLRRRGGWSHAGRVGVRAQQCAKPDANERSAVAGETCAIWELANEPAAPM